MALTDFLTSIANAIRSKDNTTAEINAQDFASRILAIPSGSNLPSFIHTGTFMLAEDTNENITVDHGFNTAPLSVFIFPDNSSEIVGVFTYSFVGGSSDIAYVIVTDYAKKKTTKNGVCTIQINDTNFIVTNTNTQYVLRSGITYRWFVWGA